MAAGHRRSRPGPRPRLASLSTFDLCNGRERMYLINAAPVHKLLFPEINSSEIVNSEAKVRIDRVRCTAVIMG